LKPINSNFVRELLAASERKNTPQDRIWLKDQRLERVKAAIREGKESLNIDDRPYIIRYFKWRKENWVTVRPVTGFMPMFSMPKNDVLSRDEL